MSKQKSPPIPGLIWITLQMPEELHERMKTCRLARRTIGMKEISLSEIYREAAEYYLNARPQRELLKGYSQTQIAESAQDSEGNGDALYADQ